MAKVTWKYPIEELHGVLKKGVMGAAQRKAKNNQGNRDAYTVMYGKRTTPYSTAELNNQATFAAVRALVEVHRSNPTQRQADQAAFKAQTAIKTFNAYLWAICRQEYEAGE